MHVRGGSRSQVRHFGSQLLLMLVLLLVLMLELLLLRAEAVLGAVPRRRNSVRLLLLRVKML